MRPDSFHFLPRVDCMILAIIGRDTMFYVNVFHPFVRICVIRSRETKMSQKDKKYHFTETFQ